MIDQGALETGISKPLSSDTTDRLADRASKAFSVSRHSYQRQLASLGITHKELTADARLTLALELLADPG